MITVKFGKGKGKGYSSAFGGLEAELNPRHTNLTIKQLANQLAKQFKVKNGEIIIAKIIFNYCKEIDKTEEAR